MTAQWIKYTGSDEQIAEIESYKDDVLGIFKSGNQALRSSLFACDFIEYLKAGQITHYLLCTPHPLEDMICQWARTGQPVWIRILGNVGINCAYSEYRWTGTHSILLTNMPDWNIPGAEYRFTPFEV